MSTEESMSDEAAPTKAPEPVKHLKSLIREIPDFPKPGILFYDITTLLKDPGGLNILLRELAAPFEDLQPDLVIGIEARGFVFGAALANRLGAGFIPVRKPNKLPAETVQVSYELEYGEDTLEAHRDAIEPGHQVLVVDDLLATGGTAAAACQLVEKLGGTVAALAFAVELTFLNGRGKLPGYEIFSLIQYHE
jgi:adenine phosphoribosyltransferase